MTIVEAPELVDNRANTEEEDLHPRDANTIPADDLVGIYFSQMVQEPLLTPEEEIALSKRIKAGSIAREALASTPNPSSQQRSEWEATLHDAQAAREHLARANTRLVVSIAKRYIRHGLPLPDLIQEGNTGLMRAVDRYDWESGTRFSTYAWWWIRQAITRALDQKSRTIRIPLHMTERIQQMYRIARVLEKEQRRRPTPEEVAAQLGQPIEDVRDMMNLSRHTFSLEHPVGDGDHQEFGDFIEDADTPQPPEVIEPSLLRKAIEDLLAELTPRQERILRLRFGLDSGEAQTLEAIAVKYGLSRERIRQLEKIALDNLKSSKAAHRLQTDFE